MLFYDIVQKISYSNSEVLNYRVSQKITFWIWGCRGLFVATADHKKKANTGPSTLKFREYLILGHPKNIQDFHASGSVGSGS